MVPTTRAVSKDLRSIGQWRKAQDRHLRASPLAVLKEKVLPCCRLRLQLAQISGIIRVLKKVSRVGSGLASTDLFGCFCPEFGAFGSSFLEYRSGLAGPANGLLQRPASHHLGQMLAILGGGMDVAQKIDALCSFLCCRG